MAAVLRITALIIPDVKTENAPSKKDSQAVMLVKWNVKKDC